MAGTIQITTNVTVTNGSYRAIFAPTMASIVQTGQGAHEGIWIVGTSEEDFSIGDITTEGWLLLLNLDSANYVTWGPKSAGVMVAMGRIKAGEPALFRMDSSSTLRAIANTSSVKLQFKLFED